MALNFLGLGFSLGAQDKGLAAAIKQTTSGLTDISRSVVDIGLASAKWALKPPDFRPALGLVNSLSNDVTTTTTALEAYGVAADKTTSASLAGLNLTEKQFKKAQGNIASLAYGMNVPVESVTKSFVALKQANVDVTKVGFKNLKQFQQVVEVTGADSAKLAGALGKMGSQMGMSNDEIKDSLKSVAAIGKKFNIGREALSGFSDTVDILNQNSNLLPQNWSPARMGKFLKGTTVVAGALTSVGLSADEAMAASRELTKGLLKGSEGMAGLYAGLEKDIPDVMSTVTEHLGDFQSAFNMLSESPDDFMLQMGKLVNDVEKMNLDPAAFNRFRLQMEKQFGPQVMAAFTKQGFGKIGPAIEEAKKPIQDQEKVLDDLAKKHRTGLTHADEFARVQTRIATELKHVNGVMKDKEYLVKYTEQSQKFLATAQELGKKGGPLGKMTTLLIDFKNRGVGGALAAQTEWGFALAQGVQLIQPMLQYLPMLTMAFKALASPIGIVAAAVAGLVFLFKDLSKGEGSVIRPFIERMTNEAPVFFEKIKHVFSQVGEVIMKVIKMIDWGAVSKAVIDGFTWVFNGILSIIDMIDWAKVGVFLGKALGVAFDIAVAILLKAVDLIGRLLGWLGGLDWGAIGKWLGTALFDLFVFALDMVVLAVKKLPGLIIEIVARILVAISGIIDGIDEALGKKFPIMASVFHAFFTGLKMVAVVVLVALAWHFGLVAVAAIASAASTIAAWAVALAPIIAIIVVLGAIGLAFKKLADLIIDNWEGIKEFFSRLWGGIKAGFKALGEAIWFLITSPIQAIKAAWNAFKGWISDVGSSIKSAFGSAADWIGDRWSDLGDLAGSAFSSITGIATEEAGKSTATVSQLVADAMNKVTEASDKAKASAEGMSGSMDLSGGVVSRVINFANDAITGFVEKAVAKTKEHMDAAAKLAYPKLGGTELLEQVQQYKDMEAQIAELAAKSQASIDEKEKKALKDKYYEIIGQQNDLVEAARKNSDKSLGYHVLQLESQLAGFDQLKNGLVGLSDLEQKSYQKRISSAASYFAQQELQLDAQHTAAKSEQEREIARAQMVKISEDRVAALAKLTLEIETQAKIASGAALDFSVNAEAQVSALASGMEAKLTASSEAAAAAWATSGPAGVAIKQSLDTLGSNFSKTLLDIQMDTKLTAQQQADAMKEAEKQFNESQAKILDIRNKYNTKLIGANDKVQADIGRRVKEETEEAMKGVDKVAEKSKAVTGIMKQEFSMSGAEAADNMGKIMAIDPGKFRGNIIVLKKELKKFLDVMDTEAKELVKNTDKNINTFFENSKKGWNDQEALIRKFGDGVDVFVTKFWRSVVDKSTEASTKIIQIAQDVGVGLSAMAKSVNLMDLLASPAQITKWAASVVAALSYAFRTGGAVDALISASYTQALKMASEVADKATPDAQAGRTETSPGAMAATLNLISTINSPTWATEEGQLIPTKLALLNEQMDKLLSVMSAPGGSATAKAKQIKPNRPGTT